MSATAVAAPAGLTGEETEATSDASADAPPPWTWPWYRCAVGQKPTLLWVLLIHVTAVVGLILFPFPGWPVLIATYALMFVGGFGTTVGYHRALAHGSVRLSPPVEFLLTAFAIFNGSGAPATWVANHRLHHAKSDTVGDISSPKIGGFWWSHLRWLWQAPQSSIERWAPDLNTGYYAFWTRWQIVILAISFGIGLPFGWAAFFWMGAFRLMFSLNAQCFVNSIAHMNPVEDPVAGSARNIGWLALVHNLQGENWHANHHAKPSSARLGWTWKQPDLGWWLIVGLRSVGLARNVRGIRPSRPAVSSTTSSSQAT